MLPIFLKCLWACIRWTKARKRNPVTAVTTPKFFAPTSPEILWIILEADQRFNEFIDAQLQALVKLRKHVHLDVPWPTGLKLLTYTEKLLRTTQSRLKILRSNHVDEQIFRSAQEILFDLFCSNILSFDWQRILLEAELEMQTTDFL